MFLFLYKEYTLKLVKTTGFSSFILYFYLSTVACIFISKSRSKYHSDATVTEIYFQFCVHLVPKELFLKSAKTATGSISAENVLVVAVVVLLCLAQPPDTPHTEHTAELS